MEILYPFQSSPSWLMVAFLCVELLHNQPHCIVSASACGSLACVLTCLQSLAHSPRSLRTPVSGDGMKTTLWRTAREHPLLTVLGQLRACQAAWCPGAAWDRDQAHTALLGQPTGVSYHTHTHTHTLLSSSYLLSSLYLFTYVCPS